MTIIKIDDANVIEGENILVDANILIFVDGAVSYDEKTKKYSDAYFQLLKNNKMFTTEKCLDEFNNRITKFYYELHRTSDQGIENFKKYRKSAAFEAEMETIYDATMSFMKDMTIISDYGFVDFEEAFNNVKSGLVDFSDIISAKYCVANNMYFFSDDSDALYCKDLKIITGNKWAISNAHKRENLARF